MMRGKYIGRLGNTPGHLQHWSASGLAGLVAQYARVRRILKPLPWTMVLAEVE
jgi:hypothetical protein